MQFAILTGLLVLLLFIGSVIGVAIISARYGLEMFRDIASSRLSMPNATTALWILQFTGTTLPLLLAPVIFSYAIVGDPNDYIKNHFDFPGSMLALVFMIMLSSLPLIELLANFNAKMQLPPALRGVQDWMRQSENQAEKLSTAMMHMKTVADLLYNLLFIGLLTAVVEEILFRGCFQRIFERWTGNNHAAVWITAILFSAFHLEFFGFLPRLLLGVLFGYFVLWSGSIWPAVWAHFVNNGSAVLATYLYQNRRISFNPDDQQSFNSSGYLVSTAVTLLLMWICWYMVHKWQEKQANEDPGTGGTT